MEKEDYSGGPWARPVRTAFFSMLGVVVLCGVWVAFTAPTPKPRTADDEQRNAISPPVGTPNIVECFFITTFQ